MLNDLPLPQMITQRIIKCDTCGEYLRGYQIKSKGLYYYKCDNKKQCSCNKNAKDLNLLFEQILQEITLQEKYIPMYKLQMEMIFSRLNDDRDQVNGNFQKQILELTKKAERLEERFINEEISAEIYQKFNLRFKAEMNAIRENLKECPINASNLDTGIKKSIRIASELPTLWASCDFFQKQRLQRLLFREGIYYNKQKGETRTTKINTVFSLIAGLEGTSGQKNNRPQDEINLKSVSVSGSRLELPSAAADMNPISAVMSL